MQVRTYRAHGMRDVLAKVKADLGPNAIILSTERLGETGQDLGPGLVQVTATTEEEAPPKSAKGLEFFQRTSKGRAPMTLETKRVPKVADPSDADLIGRLKGMLAPLMDEVRDLRAQVDQASKDHSSVLIRPSPQTIETHTPIAPEAESVLPWLRVDKKLTSDALLEKEAETLELNVEACPSGQTPFDLGLMDEPLAAAGASFVAADQALSLKKSPIEHLENWLRDSDVAFEHISGLVGGVEKRLKGREMSREGVERAFITELVSRVKILPREILDQRRRVALVGPTGVGKTTTLAKLAAEAKLDKGLSVGLITIDTYRIGGVDQLRRYANLLEVPLEVVVDRLSLERAIRRLDHCDLLLIDTIGRSPRDEEPVKRLGKLFDGIEGLSFELCISGTTAMRDMKGIMHNYRHLGVDSVTFTKLDEAFTAGPLLSSHLDLGLPLSNFTTGQRVPEDIESASVERLLAMILPILD